MSRRPRRRKGKLHVAPIEPKPARMQWIRNAFGKIKSFLARAPQPALEPKKKWFSHGVLRSTVFGASALAALGTGVAVRNHLLSPKHEIIVSLERHQKSTDLDHAFELIRAAKAAGHPFHAIGVENAAAKVGELDKFVGSYKRLCQLRHSQVEKHLQAGMPRKDAEQRMFQEMLEDYASDENNENPEHEATLEFLSYKTGLPLVPIEHYTEKQMQQISEILELSYKMSGLAITSHPALREQKKDVEAAARLYHQAIRLRNLRISKTIPEVVKVLGRNFPKMPSKGIRLIYTLGAAHASTASLSHPTADVTLAFGGSHDDLTPQITLKLNNNPEAKLSEKEKCHLVLSTHLLATLPKNSSQATSSERELLKSRLAKTTKADFAKLDQETAGKPIEEKAETIRKYLLDKK